ncbi:MAG: hypothetical protein CMJ83_06055 [Planctomycetes bacterium]|nr:hypothetical protein [Planctomycetota bacterium]
MSSLNPVHRPLLHRPILTAALVGLLAAFSLAQESFRGKVVGARGGAPVSGAKIIVFGGILRRGARRVLGQTTTGADGAFSVDDVASGPAMVTATAAGFAVGVVVLNGQDVRENLSIRLEPGRDLTGTVIDDATGKPVPDAEVTSDLLYSTRTDAEGKFALRSIPQIGDDFKVAATAPGYVPNEVPIPNGEADTSIAIRMELGQVLTVRVVDDDGSPVPNVRVVGQLPTAVPYSGIERADYSGQSNEDGLATLRGLPPGYPVTASAQVEGKLVGQLLVSMPVPARSGAEPVGVLVVSPGRQAAIEVVDGHGNPVAGADIRILPLVEPLLNFGGGVDRRNRRGAIRLGRTNGRGQMRWELLPPSPVTCEVRSRGRHTRMVVLHPSLEAAHPVRVVMDPDPDPRGTDLPWGHTLADAYARAERERLPLMLSMSMDGERANDWMASHHFHDREIVRVAREMPVILTNVFGQGGVQSPRDHTEKDGICTRYGGVPCAHHQANEGYCVDEFIGQGVAFQVPRHIFVTPAGDLMMHRTYYLSERDLVRMMIRALRHVNPQRALILARRRLQRLRHGLVASDLEVRTRAGSDLAALVNSGDEYAVALLGDLVPLGVAAGDRLRIVSAIAPDAVRMLDSGLRPFVDDPDPLIRRAIAFRTSTGTDNAARGRLLRQLVVDADPMVANAARTVLDVRNVGSKVVVTRPNQGERWRIVVTLAKAYPVDAVGGVTEVLTHGVPEARNPLLRALARKRDDRGARTRVWAEAIRVDLPALAAVRAIRAHWPSDRDEALVELASLHFGAANSLLRDEAMEVATRIVRYPGARKLLREGLEDWVPAVQVTAALGLLSTRDPGCGPVLVKYVEDLMFGPRIRAALAAERERAGPKGADGWRSWLVSEGLLPAEDEEGDR